METDQSESRIILGITLYEAAQPTETEITGHIVSCHQPTTLLLSGRPNINLCRECLCMQFVVVVFRKCSVYEMLSGVTV